MAKIDGFNVGKKYAVVTSTTPTGSVNSTSITLIHSLVIPANTFAADDLVTIETCISQSAANNTFSQYFYTYDFIYIEHYVTLSSALCSSR
jgi:hypothetical protein